MVTESDFLEMEERNTDPDFVEAEDDMAVEFVDTVAMDTKAKKTDNVGEASVEIDVESLVAEFESEASDGVDQNGRIRRRLDAMVERKRRHDELVDFEDYDLDS